jgi:hypothetical protein
MLVTVIVSVAYNTQPTQVLDVLFPRATEVEVIAVPSVGAFQANGTVIHPSYDTAAI